MKEEESVEEEERRTSGEVSGPLKWKLEPLLARLLLLLLLLL